MATCACISRRMHSEVSVEELGTALAAVAEHLEAVTLQVLGPW